MWLNRIIERGIFEYRNRIHGIIGGHHYSLSSTPIYNLHHICKLIDELTERLGKLVTCSGASQLNEAITCRKKIMLCR